MISSITVTTNASGVATAVLYSYSSSGAVTVQAAATGVASQQASLSITSDPYAISVTSSATGAITNGETAQIDAYVTNIQNNPVSDGTTVNFTIIAGNAGTLSAASANTFGGHAYVTFTADPTNFGGVTIQAAVGSLTAQTSVIVNPAQAGSIAFVSASPTLINVAGTGTSSSTVKFLVTSTVGSPKPNEPVTFALNGPFGSSLSTSSGVTDANGEVAVIVNAGPVAGQVSITATVTSINVSTQTSAVSIGGSVPSMKWFSISASKFNLDGASCDGVTSTITVRIADRFGNYNILRNTAVSFNTNFGAINASNLTDDQGVASSVYRTQDPRPTIAAQGIATVIAWTNGEENFTDRNANGMYDASYSPAEFNAATDDLTEPFLATGNSTTLQVGDLFWDWSSAVPGATPGVWNAGNGVWDSNIPIWKSIKLYITGSPSATNSNIQCCIPGSNPCTLTTGAITLDATNKSTICYVDARDSNNLTLISGTKISMTSSSTDATIAAYSGSTTLKDGPASTAQPVGFTITNKTTTGTTATLSATIDWPGSCGAQSVIIGYPGTVTLAP